jgi:putative membrane protein
MNDKPYAACDPEELTLRDYLAIDRTRLANERTLLAYLRSAVALLLAGLSILHFWPRGWFGAVGWACLPSGLLTGIVGVFRHRGMKRALLHLGVGRSIRPKPAPPCA